MIWYLPPSQVESVVSAVQASKARWCGLSLSHLSSRKIMVTWRYMERENKYEFNNNEATASMRCSNIKKANNIYIYDNYSHSPSVVKIATIKPSACIFGRGFQVNDSVWASWKSERDCQQIKVLAMSIVGKYLQEEYHLKMMIALHICCYRL